MRSLKVVNLVRRKRKEKREREERDMFKKKDMVGPIDVRGWYKVWFDDSKRRDLQRLVDKDKTLTQLEYVVLFLSLISSAVFTLYFQSKLLCHG